MPKVGIREINNVQVEIHASPSGGWTIMQPAENEEERAMALGSGDTLDKAVTAARNEIKRRQIKVAVPFKTREGKRGVASGRHARSRDKILTEVQGEKIHIGYRETVFKPDMPKEEIEHLNELGDEEAKLRAEQREIIKKWSFDLGKAVDTAINEASEESK